MKTFLAGLLALLTLIPSVAQAQRGEGRENRGNGGGFPRGGGQFPRGDNDGGGRRDFPRQQPRQQPRQDFPRQQPRQDFPRQDRQDRRRGDNGFPRNDDWQNRRRQELENESRRRQAQDEANRRRQAQDEINRRRQQDELDRIRRERRSDQGNGNNGGNWDGRNRGGNRNGGGTVVVPPRRDNDGIPGRDRRVDRNRGGSGGVQDRVRGRLGGPNQRPTERPPVLRDGRGDNPRFGSVVRPSLRNHDEVRRMHDRTPNAWPRPHDEPRGYDHWRRAPRRDHRDVTFGSTWILGDVNVHLRTENRRGGYWWHHRNGVRYSHHCDSWGYHWYGWYVGSHYYWTRWHDGYWWWHDPVRRRWVYYYGGRWWWQDPFNTRVVYIYVDDSDTYYRYDDRVDRVVLQPETPNGAPDTQTVYSTDGSRMVQIVGQEKNAYLHDTAEKPSFEPVWLGKGVTEARFKYLDGGDGDVVVDQVLVLKADGSFDVFDGEGYARQPAAPQETPALDSLNQLDPHE